MAFYQGDYVGAVVADIGSSATKIGWAGDDYPKSYFRSVRNLVIPIASLELIVSHASLLLLRTERCRVTRRNSHGRF